MVLLLWFINDMYFILSYQDEMKLVLVNIIYQEKQSAYVENYMYMYMYIETHIHVTN